MIAVITAPARWAFGIGREVAQLPLTIRRARQALSDLPDSLHELTETLRGLQAIDEHVVEMRQTVENLDQSLRASLGVVPGMRRAMRREASSSGS